MSIRKAKMIVNKSGAGNSTFRATLPNSWIREMGLNEETRDLIITFDKDKIIILKEDAGMENIIVNISQHEGIKLTGVKLSSEVIEEGKEIRYDHVDNGVHSPYEIKIKRIKEKWEVLRTDAKKEELNIVITEEEYKNRIKQNIICEKIRDLILYEEWTEKDLELYGEVVKL